MSISSDKFNFLNFRLKLRIQVEVETSSWIFNIYREAPSQKLFLLIRC